MKTLATLALLGFASAINLHNDDELARELTDIIMETCGGGSCKKDKCDLYELETNLASTDISLAT